MERLLQEHLAIGHGAESPHYRRAGGTDQSSCGKSALSGLVKLVIRNILYAVRLIMRNAQFIQDCQAKFLCHCLIVHVQDSAAHDYRLMEQTLGARHAHQGSNLSATAGLTENGHIIRITAKLADIVTNPLQCLDGIHHTHITRILVLGVTCG